MTTLRLDRSRIPLTRGAAARPTRGADRLAASFLLRRLAIGVAWVLATDALLARLSPPPWVGSAKDVLYLVACALATHRAALGYARAVRLEHRVEAEVEGKRELVGRLAMAAEYRDDETGGHNHRIGLTAQILGRELGMDREACERLFYAAALHDLGKIAVSDDVLHKPGPLTPEERQEMQRHAQRGADLLAGSEHPLLRMAHDVALGHHERWDGAGYPNGLGGAAIPVEARIVAVCDVFDALMTDRPYKRAWAIGEAVEEIRRSSGSHFDPAVVEAFLRCREEIESARGEKARPWDVLRRAA